MGNNFTKNSNTKCLEYNPPLTDIDNYNINPSFNKPFVKNGCFQFSLPDLLNFRKDKTSIFVISKIAAYAEYIDYKTNVDYWTGFYLNDNNYALVINIIEKDYYKVYQLTVTEVSLCINIVYDIDMDKYIGSYTSTSSTDNFRGQNTTADIEDTADYIYAGAGNNCIPILLTVGDGIASYKYLLNPPKIRLQYTSVYDNNLYIMYTKHNITFPLYTTTETFLEPDDNPNLISEAIDLDLTMSNTNSWYNFYQSIISNKNIPYSDSPLNLYEIYNLVLVPPNILTSPTLINIVVPPSQVNAHDVGKIKTIRKLVYRLFDQDPNSNIYQVKYLGVTNINMTFGDRIGILTSDEETIILILDDLVWEVLPTTPKTLVTDEGTSFSYLCNDLSSEDVTAIQDIITSSQASNTPILVYTFGAYLYEFLSVAATQLNSYVTNITNNSGLPYIEIFADGVPNVTFGLTSATNETMQYVFTKEYPNYTFDFGFLDGDSFAFQNRTATINGVETSSDIIVQKTVPPTLINNDVFAHHVYSYILSDYDDSNYYPGYDILPYAPQSYLYLNNLDSSTAYMAKNYYINILPITLSSIAISTNSSFDARVLGIYALLPKDRYVSGTITNPATYYYSNKGRVYLLDVVREGVVHRKLFMFDDFANEVHSTTDVPFNKNGTEIFKYKSNGFTTDELDFLSSSLSTPAYDLIIYSFGIYVFDFLNEYLTTLDNYTGGVFVQLDAIQPDLISGYSTSITTFSSLFSSIYNFTTIVTSNLSIDELVITQNTSALQVTNTLTYPNDTFGGNQHHPISYAKASRYAFKPSDTTYIPLISDMTDAQKIESPTNYTIPVPEDSPLTIIDAPAETIPDNYTTTYYYDNYNISIPKASAIDYSMAPTSYDLANVRLFANVALFTGTDYSNVLKDNGTVSVKKSGRVCLVTNIIDDNTKVAYIIFLDDFKDEVISNNTASTMDMGSDRSAENFSYWCNAFTSDETSFISSSIDTLDVSYGLVIYSFGGYIFRYLSGRSDTLNKYRYLYIFVDGVPDITLDASNIVGSDDGGTVTLNNVLNHIPNNPNSIVYSFVLENDEYAVTQITGRDHLPPQATQTETLLFNGYIHHPYAYMSIDNPSDPFTMDLISYIDESTAFYLDGFYFPDPPELTMYDMLIDQPPTDRSVRFFSYLVLNRFDDYSNLITNTGETSVYNCGRIAMVTNTSTAGDNLVYLIMLDDFMAETIPPSTNGNLKTFVTPATPENSLNFSYYCNDFTTSEQSFLENNFDTLDSSYGIVIYSFGAYILEFLNGRTDNLANYRFVSCYVDGFPQITSGLAVIDTNVPITLDTVFQTIAHSTLYAGQTLTYDIFAQQIDYATSGITEPDDPLKPRDYISIDQLIGNVIFKDQNGHDYSHHPYAILITNGTSHSTQYFADTYPMETPSLTMVSTAVDIQTINQVREFSYLATSDEDVATLASYITNTGTNTVFKEGRVSIVSNLDTDNIIYIIVVDDYEKQAISTNKQTFEGTANSLQLFYYYCDNFTTAETSLLQTNVYDVIAASTGTYGLVIYSFGPYVFNILQGNQTMIENSVTFCNLYVDGLTQCTLGAFTYDYTRAIGIATNLFTNQMNFNYVSTIIKISTDLNANQDNTLTDYDYLVGETMQNDIYYKVYSHHPIAYILTYNNLNLMPYDPDAESTAYLSNKYIFDDTDLQLVMYDPTNENVTLDEMRKWIYIPLTKLLSYDALISNQDGDAGDTSVVKEGRVTVILNTSTTTSTNRAYLILLDDFNQEVAPTTSNTMDVPVGSFDYYCNSLTVGEISILDDLVNIDPSYSLSVYSFGAYFLQFLDGRISSVMNPFREFGCFVDGMPYTALNGLYTLSEMPTEFESVFGGTFVVGAVLDTDTIVAVNSAGTTITPDELFSIPESPPYAISFDGYDHSAYAYYVATDPSMFYIVTPESSKANTYFTNNYEGMENLPVLNYARHPTYYPNCFTGNGFYFTEWAQCHFYDTAEEIASYPSDYQIVIQGRFGLINATENKILYLIARDDYDMSVASKTMNNFKLNSTDASSFKYYFDSITSDEKTFLDGLQTLFPSTTASGYILILITFGSSLWPLLNERKSFFQTFKSFSIFPYSYVPCTKGFGNQELLTWLQSNYTLALTKAFTNTADAKTIYNPVTEFDNITITYTKTINIDSGGYEHNPLTYVSIYFVNKTSSVPVPYVELSLNTPDYVSYSLDIGTFNTYCIWYTTLGQMLSAMDNSLMLAGVTMNTIKSAGRLRYYNSTGTNFNNLIVVLSGSLYDYKNKLTLIKDFVFNGSTLFQYYSKGGYTQEEIDFANSFNFSTMAFFFGDTSDYLDFFNEATGFKKGSGMPGIFIGCYTDVIINYPSSANIFSASTIQTRYIELYYNYYTLSSSNITDNPDVSTITTFTGISNIRYFNNMVYGYPASLVILNFLAEYFGALTTSSGFTTLYNGTKTA